MVSVLILTHNEEVNIGRCLDSVCWSDDVLVLDSFSTDGTHRILQKRGIRWLQHQFVDFAQQRNFGLERGGLRHGWVLHLDADEVVSDDLRAELEHVARAGAFPAYRVASKMIFEGRWLRFAGMFPAYQVRFGRRDLLRFKMVGHGQRETLPPDAVGTLSNALLHHSFSKGLADWHARHERYAAAEAEENIKLLQSGVRPWEGLFSTTPTERRRALKALSVRLPCRPLLRFIYMYVLHLGFLDGRPGYEYCRLLSRYERMIVLKMKEIQRRQRGLGV